jgi:L-fuculose-phosphate aldolase
MNRKKIKQELVGIGKKIAERMLVVGPGGNISARAGGLVCMKASGVTFEEAKETDYVGVNLKTGKLIDGKLRPTSEINMHLACYRVRSNINAVIHTHPTYATAYGMLGKTLHPFTPDFVAFVRSSIPAIRYIVPTGKELAEAVSCAVKKHNGVFMMNHGLLTVGFNLKEAYYRTLLIEESIKTIIGAKILGKMRFLTKHQINQINNLSAETYRRKKLGSTG